MKLAFLATGDIHTAKWVNSFSAAGHEVHLIVQEPIWEKLQAHIHFLPFPRPWGGVLNFWKLRRLLNQIKPDLLHVHGASLDGLLGRLSGFHPSMVSVLGSDIFAFPEASRLKRRILIDNLKYYDWIGSTSECMARQVLQFLPGQKKLTVTPFGVDIRTFSPQPTFRNDALITVGTVKILRPQYGIDLLIKAFALTRSRLNKALPDTAKKMRLLIVGSGPEKTMLVNLTKKLAICEIVEFIPYVLNKEVPALLNRMDIFVALSRRESFGVAVVEAAACGLPVVVSNVGGLPEIVNDGETGFVVEPDNAELAAQALARLASDAELRRKMGEAGRLRVKREFEWSNCVRKMEALYAEVLASRSNGTLSA